MKTATYPRRLFPAALAGLLALAGARGRAQTLAQPPGASGPVVQLDPFVVNTTTDNGYIATDSLAGGRFSMPIRLTPSTMSSITRAFMNDLQLTDVRSALQWTPNIVPQSWNGGRDGGGDVFNSWSYNIRGAGTGPQGGNPPTVNYFPFYGVKDLFNVDRLEVDRGPNSILFGVGNFGGSLSTYTKTPRFDRDFQDEAVLLNSWGGARSTVDVNATRDNHYAMRVNAVGDWDQGWRKDDLTRKWGGSIANTWKLTDATTVRFDVEGFRRKTPQFAYNLTDNFSQWDGKTGSATWGASPSGGTAATNSMAEWGGPTSTYVWIPADKTLMNWGAGYRGAGISDGPYYINAVMRPYAYTIGGGSGLTVPRLPTRDFTVGPKDGLFDWQYYTLTAYLDQRINPHAGFELAAYRYADRGVATNFESPTNADVDINRQMPNGQPNPHFGQIYSDMFLDRQIQDHSANEFRGQVNYHFDVDLWRVPLNEWVSASAGEEFHLLTTRQYIATMMNGYTPANWTQNMVWAREYWNQPNTSINLPKSFNGDPIVYLALPFNWFDHDLVEEIKYGGVVSQTRAWDDRLNVTLGARHDEYWSRLVNVRGTGNLPAVESNNGTTYSAGVIGYVLPWFGLTYNYSSNFAPIGGGVAPSLYGAQFGPATGKSNAAGFRISTLDQRYYISADYYVDRAHGRISNDSVPLQGIWNDYFKAGGTATDIGPAGSVTGSAAGNTLHANMSYADTQDVKDEGIELDAVANPTPNWRIQASYAQPKSSVDNDLPGTRAYFAQHLAEWAPLETSGIAPYAGTLKSDITNSQVTLANSAGSKTSAGLVKSTFSFFAAYTFTGGWADGLTLGAGATALGAQNITTGGTVSSPSYELYNALVSYTTRFGRFRTKFQLNADNLFGSKELVFLQYDTFADGAGQGSNYRFVDPRKLTFSVTLSM